MKRKIKKEYLTCEVIIDSVAAHSPAEDLLLIGKTRAYSPDELLESRKYYFIITHLLLQREYIYGASQAK